MRYQHNIGHTNYLAYNHVRLTKYYTYLKLNFMINIFFKLLLYSISSTFRNSLSLESSTIKVINKNKCLYERNLNNSNLIGLQTLNPRCTVFLTLAKSLGLTYQKKIQNNNCSTFKSHLLVLFMAFDINLPV